MDEGKFESIIVDTKEVVKELKAVSSTYKLSLKNIDFHLLETITFFRTNSEEEWEELTEDKREMFETDEFLAHESLEVFQQYKIEIFQVDQKEEDLLLPNITLGSNKSLTSVIATIHKSYDIDTSKFLEKNLTEAINKKKVRAGILVGIREKNMKKEINVAASKMMVDGFLEKDVAIEVMECLKPIQCVDDEVIMHYQKKINKEDEQGRINYARRGYVLPVAEGEIVIEYIKAKVGKDGRNCRGQYIKVREPVEKNNQPINTTEMITRKEDDDSIKYIATKQGYVKEDKGVFDIQDEMELDAIDFKSTGSIEAGVDSNVTINIKEKDEFKDAIGAGMKVETSILNVEGSVANNAKIKANDVRIGGQTHKTSYIEADKANVTVHKGTIVAKEVDIDRLEGGKVTADVVRVKNIIGGSITAREIHVETLMSNAHLVTSELIDIKHTNGSNNKILIDPSQIKGLSEKIDGVTKKIESAKKEYAAMPKHIEYKREIIENNKEAIGAIKKRVLELKAKKITPPANLTGKLKEYQQLVSEYNSLIKDFKDKKEEIRVLKDELEEHQAKVFSAKVVNHSAWSEFNEIRFKLIYPPIEIVHNTRKNEMSREITLEKTTEDEYEIVRSTEFKK